MSARSKTLMGHPDADTVLRGTTLGGSGTFARVEPRDLIRGIVTRVRPHAEAKDVDVVVYCTSGPVWVEPRAFSDALFEVLDNAVRATRRGYPVFVHVRDTADGDVLWQIQDEGEGMTERDLARLGHAPDAAEGRRHHGQHLATGTWSGRCLDELLGARESLNKKLKGSAAPLLSFLGEGAPSRATTPVVAWVGTGRFRQRCRWFAGTRRSYAGTPRGVSRDDAYRCQRRRRPSAWTTGRVLDDGGAAAKRT